MAPGKVKANNKNMRATSQHTLEEGTRLRPQLEAKDLKRFTKPEVGRYLAKSSLNMEYHEETAQLPLNPNIPSKNHKKIGLPSDASLVLIEKQPSLRVHDPSKKSLVRHPSKGQGPKTLETSPNLRRKQKSPQDKENHLAAKNRNAFGAKN